VSETPQAPKLKMRHRPNWDDDTDVGNIYVTPDCFAVNPELVKDMRKSGFDLLWVATESYGQQLGRHAQTFFERGWTPLAKGDFDGAFDRLSEKSEPDADISVGGQTLCVRPLILSEKSKGAEARAAKAAIDLVYKGLLGEGVPGAGGNHPSAVAGNRIRREIEPVEISRD
jgi:hypothetical protein